MNIFSQPAMLLVTILRSKMAEIAVPSIPVAQTIRSGKTLEKLSGQAEHPLDVAFLANGARRDSSTVTRTWSRLKSVIHVML